MEKILIKYPGAIFTNNTIEITLFNDNNIHIKFDLVDINLSYVLNVLGVDENLTYFLRKLIKFINDNYLEEFNNSIEDKIINVSEALEKKFSKKNDILNGF